MHTSKIVIIQRRKMGTADALHLGMRVVRNTPSTGSPSSSADETMSDGVIVQVIIDASARVNTSKVPRAEPAEPPSRPTPPPAVA